MFNVRVRQGSFPIASAFQKQKKPFLNCSGNGLHYSCKTIRSYSLTTIIFLVAVKSSASSV